MTHARAASAIASLLVLLVVACNEEKSKSEAPQAAPAPSTVPPSAAAPTAPAGESVTGTVAETMDAAGYTYLHIKTAAGDKWAAVPQTKLAVGDKVTILNPMVMSNFSSPTLKKTFDEILFGTLGGLPGAGSPTAPTGAPGSATPAAVSTAPVARVAGPTGHTVAEIFAGKATLKDKPVAVRGRVVKYNTAILGHNWVHLVDGSGSKAGGDGDLTVTTQGTASVGDVIVVRGVVHLDKDFGSGYAYPVLLEDATIEK